MRVSQGCNCTRGINITAWNLMSIFRLFMQVPWDKRDVAVCRTRKHGDAVEEDKMPLAESGKIWFSIFLVTLGENTLKLGAQPWSGNVNSRSIQPYSWLWASAYKTSCLWLECWGSECWTLATIKSTQPHPTQEIKRNKRLSWEHKAYLENQSGKTWDAAWLE